MSEAIHIQAFVDGIFAENCYLLIGPSGKRAAIVDPGFQTSAVLKEVERRKLEVEWIVNTHAHIDHIAGNHLARETTGAPLILHPDDADQLRGLEGQRRFLESMGLRLPLTLEPSPEPDRWFDESEPFVFDGVAFRVLHTPGHSPGGVCLVAGDLALVGDTLFQGSIGRTDLPGGSMPQLLESIRAKLFALPGATVCWPGHGGQTTIEAERLHNPFVSDRAVERLRQEPG